MIKIKRAYDNRADDDGFRVLVDRLWPRGVSKEEAHVDLWLKEVAPSDELRMWFGYDPERWTEFRRRYKAELKDHANAVGELKDRAKHGTLTLVYGAKDIDHNNAVALKEALEK